ncbi:Cytochrome P450 CYP5336A1 [Metarhizium robertsii ARSEF 23]|uniref:Cytochrome P450 CYP5336A1 n=1 Tax=Metarhizium robertsii (strain ARSEF 23 / ATCC MYA-3075) TaxID=655844 RepID=E9F2V5_METRA|nr:Cytochrome P450 CYP5336A1 [Metarhizium robertsii ARSEF 23]EFY97821.2 Cytochrome P450 CYP5336A1 [Metarhizium robertsii ARSEF 23]
MALDISWPMVLGATIAYLATVAAYRLFLHPLARFPGPKLAAISRWYEAYYDVVLGGQYTAKIAELHGEYGPIIRISPYELHVADAKFFDTLYRMEGRWDKYSWTYDAFGAKGSTVFCSDHHVHKARRRAIAPFFSKANVLDRQALLHRNVGKLCRRLSDLSGTAVNLGAAISAFTRDNANEYIIGKAYNELDLEDFGIGLSIASQGAGMFWRATKHIRWFGPAQSEQDTRDTLAAEASSSPDTEVQNTMVHAIVKSDLAPAEKSFERIYEEVATVTGAGFETSANALRLILFHVYTNDAILGRLREEISSLTTKSSEPITLRQLEQLPYLTGVLREGLRLSPGVASRAARITDKDLAYNDWCIPAGTPVGMTTILIHTDQNLYPDPMCFNPDRWIDQGAEKAVVTKFAPFSRGTRICLGMHLAWAEMYLVLAALVQRFSFTIEGVAASDFELDKDNFGIGTKAGCNLMARVDPYEG